MNFVDHVPEQYKESVNIVRENALSPCEPDDPEIGDEIDVASDVVCYIVPDDAIVTVDGGVPIKMFGYKAHLQVPNDAIAEGDILKRPDGSKLQVYRVRPRGSDIMQLFLREEIIA